MSPRSMMLSLFHPRSTRMSATCDLASALFPLMKTLWSPGKRCGLTMTLQFIVLRALTTLAPGKALCMRSASESVLQKARKGGGPPDESNGLATSMRTLPSRLLSPAILRASIETTPDVQLKMTSPNAAASAKVPSEAPGPADLAHAAAFSLSRVLDPIMTSCPCSASLPPIAWPTIPVPKTPIFIPTYLISTTYKDGSNRHSPATGPEPAFEAVRSAVAQ